MAHRRLEGQSPPDDLLFQGVWFVFEQPRAKPPEPDPELVFDENGGVRMKHLLEGVEPPEPK